MYGKFAHKYLILQAAIYLINIFFVAYLGLKWVIAAALPKKNGAVVHPRFFRLNILIKCCFRKGCL